MSTKQFESVKSAAIILAAGTSSRMGQSKQLLKVNGESLIRKIILTTIPAVNNVVVVLGAEKKNHQEEISDLPVQVTFNQDWANGIGSSIKCGVLFLQNYFPECEIAVILVCDQPMLTTFHLQKLLQAYQSTNNPIIASSYAGATGVPVLFHQTMFASLLNIDDDHGAKKIINNYLHSASIVDFPEGAIDLDTPEDWRKFNDK